MNFSRKILLATAAAAAISAAASSALAQNTANANVSIQAKLIAPITITAGTNLNFGTVFTNASAQTVSVSTANALGGTAVALASSTHSPATFTVGGTNGQLFDASYGITGLPAGFTLTGLTTDGCGQTGGSGTPVTGLTTAGVGNNCTLTIGATLNIPAAAAAQSVAGTLTTTVTYE